MVMVPPTPPVQPINIMAAMSQGESFRAARMRNDLNERTLAMRKRVSEMRKMMDNGAEIVAKLREDGHHDAADMFIDQQRQRYLSAMEVVRTGSRWIRDKASYEEVRSKLIDEGSILPTDMPVEYNPGWFTKEAGRLKNKLSTFEQTVGVSPEGVRQTRQITQDSFGNIMAESPVYGNVQDLQQQRAGRAEARADRAEARADRQDRGRPALPPSVSNAINRAIAGPLGASISYGVDGTPQVHITDPRTRGRYATVYADAERRLKEGIADSVGQAAAQALRAAGIPFITPDALDTEGPARRAIPPAPAPVFPGPIGPAGTSTLTPDLSDPLNLFGP